jgi:hypothetical protein
MILARKSKFFKYVICMLVVLFVFPVDFILPLKKKEPDYKLQLVLAKREFRAGNYTMAKDRLERLLMVLDRNTPEHEKIRKKSLKLLERIKKKVIEVPGSKPSEKKKRFPVLLVAGGVAIVAALVFLVFKKKKPSPTPTTPDFVISPDNVTVLEGGTATFAVKLSASPSAEVSASVLKISGDEDINVQSGSNLTFSSSNWNQDQVVTLAANEDVDVTNGTATFRLSATGIQISEKDISATEQDNDVLRFVTNTDSVTVPERGTATFSVRLSNEPPSDIQATVSRASGDSDITVESGQNLVFTTSNWDIDQTVTLRAANDDDTANGEAIIQISATGVSDKDITAAEEDDDRERCSLSVSITSPANNVTVSGIVTIKANVSGTCVIDRVEFIADGSAIHADTTVPYRAEWDTSIYFEGSHTIKVIAYAVSGETASHQITVTISR